MPAKEASVLSSWKEIALYLNKGVRTAQRWERELGLPVLRLREGEGEGRVIAHRAELEAWLQAQWTCRKPAPQRPPQLSVSSLPRVRRQLQTHLELLSVNESLRGEMFQALQALRAQCEELTKNLRNAPLPRGGHTDALLPLTSPGRAA